MIFKKLLSGILAATVVAGALVGCGSTTNNTNAKAKSSKELPEVVNIGTQQMPTDESLARTKGFFEEELGVKVNITEFDSGKDVNNALASKSIDFGLMGSTPATVGIASGIPIELIWIHDVIGDIEALAVKNSANINKISDLVGKKVAVPASSTAHYSLLNALKINNISESDVKILDMQPNDIYAAWQRGDIDATYVWEPTLGKLLGDGKILVTSRELAAQGVLTCDTEVVRKEFAEKYPELVTKYIKALEKANDIYKNNPNDAIETIAKALGISKEESAHQINASQWLSGKEQLDNKYLGTSDKKGDFVKTLKSTSDFLLEQKTITNSPEISVFEKAVNPKYIEDSLK
ncbi:aliphatic sulfonate ABC transporter substrate-binding protein [Clostridium chromiireducens]|uniref:Aliphatic sulfonate ABC transporter substrate-binding protein n=1 Tax=Clostridium chromiireducens TaxID=225345 RepID=A0A399IJ31_9CLOT|nr:aliphatic sulfonate ABC transporter substrate-binding protein [Clostridium chromiireducens]RII33023.1 aliphatic sulfonate ABC transporter substrate-binding protein [Clostridium chromiireducens]